MPEPIGVLCDGLCGESHRPETITAIAAYSAKGVPFTLRLCPICYEKQFVKPLLAAGLVLE